FAIVYVVEGLGQVGGLIAQPLSYYLKQEHGWTSSQVSAYLTIFNFPWIIKPVYGIFSDFVPLFGYRRKGYLIAANIVATGAFLFRYYFSAGLSTPLYYTMTDGLKFPQGYIGILGSISSAGWIVGALLYRRLFGDLSSKRLLQLSIALGTITTAAYLLLTNEL